MQRAGWGGGGRVPKNFNPLPLLSPTTLRRAVPLSAAIVAIAAALTASDAGAAMPAECRNVSCAGTLSVGRAPVLWNSPQVFYPNNERVFAAAAVGATALSEVRVYGPALCRHRFVGAGTTVVIKACGSQTPIWVRALRQRRGARPVRISYAARPMLDADSGTVAPPAAPSIFDQLRQITGLPVP